MKFFLINPDYMLYGDPPIGIAYLAAYVRDNCPFVHIEILDQLNSKEILENIKKGKPDLVGLTAVSSNYFSVKKLAKKIKKISPNSVLIIGGVHITTFPESFNDSPFDMAVRGEGEITTTNLLNSLKQENKINPEKLFKIPGLLFRNKGKIINTGLGEYIKDLNEIPSPARDLLNMKYYSLPRFSSQDSIEPIGSILTSRGCPYSCKFCSSSCFWGRRVRFFSSKKVIDEIEILYDTYGYSHIYIYDDLFSINKKRLKEIIDGLKKRNILGKVKFSVYGRANCFDEEIAKLLKKMNVKTIIFGFETGSQRLLTFLKGEGITIEDSINAIKLSKKYKLNPGGFFMLGSPTETLGDMEKTYEFIKRYCRKNFIIYQTLAFPGTDFWRYALKNKIIDKFFYEKEQKEFVDINTDILLSKEISPKQFESYFRKINSLMLGKKSVLLSKILKIRPRHLKPMLSREFLKKAINLKKDFFKKIS